MNETPIGSDNRKEMYQALSLFLLSSASSELILKKMSPDYNPMELLKFDSELGKRIATFDDPSIFELVEETPVLYFKLKQIVDKLSELNKQVLEFSNEAKQIKK